MSVDQSYRQDLNIRLMCKNCRTDPPNIIEETANGDLVSSFPLRWDRVGLRVRSVGIVGLCLGIEWLIRGVNVSSWARRME
jgi:hypothetical protein